MARPIVLISLCVLVIVAVAESASASVVEQPREVAQVQDLVQEQESVLISDVKAVDSDIEPAICKRKGFGCRKGKQCCSKRCVKKKCA